MIGEIFDTYLRSKGLDKFMNRVLFASCLGILFYFARWVISW